MLQNYEQKSRRIRETFLKSKAENPQAFRQKLSLSWSSWIFGIEDIEDSLIRLKSAGIDYIELKADHHTLDSGRDPSKLLPLLDRYGISVSGSVGIFSPENELASNSVFSRQRAMDYIRREVEFLRQVHGTYMIVVPAAVGRPDPLDDAELLRSAESLRLCGDQFLQSGILAAIEPIRAAEVSIVHSVQEALDFIQMVNHPGVNSINGDIYHMMLQEEHIGEAILRAGEHLVNLHLADSNRDGLGRGMIDLDTVIMACYLIGMNRPGRFVTPEPLGPYPVPYDLMNKPCNRPIMDDLVRTSAEYFRRREEYLLNL